MLPAWAVRLHQAGGSIPYGVAIAAGALFIYPLTRWPALLATGLLKPAPSFKLRRQLTSR